MHFYQPQTVQFYYWGYGKLTANKSKISRQLLGTYCYVVYLALFHFPHSLRDKDPLTPRHRGVGLLKILVGTSLFFG